MVPEPAAMGKMPMLQTMACGLRKERGRPAPGFESGTDGPAPWLKLPADGSLPAGVEAGAHIPAGTLERGFRLGVAQAADVGDEPGRPIPEFNVGDPDIDHEIAPDLAEADHGARR